MRRAAFAVVTTIAVMALLLGYKTHDISAPSVRPALLVPPDATTQGVAEGGADLTTQISASPSAPASSDHAPRRHYSGQSVSSTPTALTSPSLSPADGDRPKPSPASTSPAGPSGHPTRTPTAEPTHPGVPTGVPTTPPATPGTGRRSIDGTTVGTIYGNVQVRIALDDDRITGVTLLQVPDQDDMDRDINDVAVPKLIQQTLARQHAQLDVVSGATYTSVGYMTSLQAAIDAAHL